ncbi:MAG: TonB-dependent receptor [Flavobacteriia bacterium]|nr:TonB-dependent receptor [Flavobacteriia bacterium]
MLNYKIYSFFQIYCKILFFICLSNFSFSQEFKGKIIGNVKDSSTNANVEFATVKLFSKIDSTFIKGDVTDSLGNFNILNVPNGIYYITVDFIGYDLVKTSPVELNDATIFINLKSLLLIISKTNTIDQVNIVGKQNAFEIGLDKKVYNVGTDLSTKGGSANDVLIKVPSVDIDQDGKISLRGDGNVTILIDGRPSSMSGGNGKSLLDAIPASQIERIEIISNPSAKYDPDGTSGIINIVLKKNKLRGTNGMISATAGTKDLYNTSLSFSIRNSKINSYVNYSYKYSVGYRNNFGDLKRLIDDQVISKLNQSRLGMDSNLTHSLKIGSDFYISSSQTIGFSVAGTSSDRARTGNLTNRLYNGQNLLQNYWTRSSYDPTYQQNLDINLNHKLELNDKKGTFETNFTESLGNSDNYGYYQELYYTTDSVLNAFAPKNQKLTDLEKNNVFTGQTDFIRIIDSKKARIEAGVKAIVRNLGVNTTSQTMDTLSQNYFTDTLSNFIYSYNEQVYSAYAIYGQQKGKFKYQGGLRFEQAFQNPFLKSMNEKFTNNYFNIYPSGHFKYNHRENTEWSLSYSRRINRASSEDLNPFTSYADPFNLRKGNPALKPEYINSFDLGYSIDKKKVNIVTSLYYRYTTDVIQRVKIFTSTNAATITFANIDQSHSGGVEFVLSYKPTKWWRNMISFNGSYIRFIDNTANYNYNNSGFNFSAKYVGSIEYWKHSMTTQLNIQYNAPQTTAQGIIQRRGAIEISTEKSLYKGKWAIGLRVSDVLDRQGFSLKVRQPTIQQDAEFKWLTRRIYLTVTYKFGKIEMMNKPKTGIDSGGGGMDF